MVKIGGLKSSKQFHRFGTASMQIEKLYVNTVEPPPKISSLGGRLGELRPKWVEIFPH